MSEMLKRVGAAILEAESRWTPKSDEPKERVMARAAVDAMREPTEEMAASVTEILSHFDGEYGDYNVYFEERQGKEIWQAMIDAAA